MSLRHIDCCIIGQGIAGTTFAWGLHRRGRKIAVIDAGTPVTASRIAAGLITPITGPKLAKTWHWEICRPVAETFYREIENLTGSTLWHPQPAIHLLRSEAEAIRFRQRMLQPEFTALARELPSDSLPAGLNAPWGAFEMPTAAKLDVTNYLITSRQHFLEQQISIQDEVLLPADIQLTEHSVRLPRLGLSADRVLFCCGFHDVTQTWFSPVRFNPAKGEILSLQIPGWQTECSLHAGVWLAPLTDGTFRLGSTFEWNELDTVPTAAAREELLNKLAESLPLKAHVIDHRAAVRPTMHDFKPVLGFHPQEPRIGILNGLGTKGALMAPWLADQLIQHLEQQTPIAEEMDVKRWFR